MESDLVSNLFYFGLVSRGYIWRGVRGTFEEDQGFLQR